MPSSEEVESEVLCKNTNNELRLKDVALHEICFKWLVGFETDNMDLDIPESQESMEPIIFPDVKNQLGWIDDILLANKITNSGLPNKMGCRIPLKTHWNLELFEKLLCDYHDNEIVDWLRYGFSISHDNSIGDPVPAKINHRGAVWYPQAIDKYFQKEIALGATIGPFIIPPFISKIGISPLSSRPKRDTSDRRVILDLSFPLGFSVNDGISKTQYCGETIKLTYPTLDKLIERIVQLGPGCLLFKRDTSRCFRQLPLCPADYSLIGMRWRNLLYFDKYMPMGLRLAA